MLAPERIWWKPLHRFERTWLIIAFVWCLMLTAMMPIWFLNGRQNVPTVTYKTTPAQYQETVNNFVAEYQVDTLNGVPVVAPPPNSDVYILARQWQWYPILQLESKQRCLHFGPAMAMVPHIAIRKRRNLSSASLITRCAAWLLFTARQSKPASAAGLRLRSHYHAYRGRRIFTRLQRILPDWPPSHARQIICRIIKLKEE